MGMSLLPAAGVRSGILAAFALSGALAFAQAPAVKEARPAGNAANPTLAVQVERPSATSPGRPPAPRSA
jgi:hypothetical protein